MVYAVWLFSISIAAAIVIFRDHPFIVGAYGRVFGRYPAQLPVPAPQAPTTAEAPPQSGEPQASADGDEASPKAP